MLSKSRVNRDTDAQGIGQKRFSMNDANSLIVTLMDSILISYMKRRGKILTTCLIGRKNSLS
jgi:hypothetical protein